MTNLKVFALVFGLIAFYTFLANAIPQVESEVPEELSFSTNVTPEELVAAGEQLYSGAGGCTACHGLGTRAPNLLADEGGTGTIGARCSSRVQGQDCKTYLHDSMIQPTAYVVAGYDPIMPDMSRTLSGAQIWSMVAYLQSQGGEVTVTGEDVASAGDAGGAATGSGTAGAGGATGGPLAGGSTDPAELVQAGTCTACHVIDGQGTAVGPSLDGVGARRDAASIRAKILNPRSDTTAGFEALAGIMPPTFGQQFNAAQLEALVQYLSSRR
jgi:mono/diheme cytochrome c family protein